MEKLVVKIVFCEGMKMDRSLKELKLLKKRIEIPKKGFIHRKKTLKEIQRKKKCKKIYGQLIDLIELTKELKGKVTNKELHYWEVKEKGEQYNYMLVTVLFSCSAKREKFEEIFSDLYPELEIKKTF